MPHTHDSPAARRLVPPYVTAWSAEPYLPARVVQRGGRIAYANENADDRDERGVLWYQSPSRQGQGRPDFGRVHPQRQWEAMSQLLCQVCAGPADQTEDGVLWLLVPDYDDDWTNWPEGMAVAEPPVCRPCARRAVRQCPALRNSVAVVRVRDYPIIGVRGALHKPAWPSPTPVAHVIMAFDHPAIGWVRASSLLRELHGCTILPAEELVGPQ
jgi:hypothetical protein